MSVTELIEQLEGLRRLYGDVQVYPTVDVQIGGPPNEVCLIPYRDEWEDFDDDDDDF